LVTGASGSGKSSLVRAGVLPKLTEPGVIEGVSLWRRAVFGATLRAVSDSPIANQAKLLPVGIRPKSPRAPPFSFGPGLARAAGAAGIARRVNLS
jgi:hypothetical protein